MNESAKVMSNNQATKGAWENVCRRAFANDPCYHYPIEYQGQTIYFCTEFCQQAFQADPDRFYTAHHHRHSEG